MSAQMKGEKVINTSCCCHCGGACFLRVHVKDNVITRIESDNGGEPQFRACLRCRAYRQRVYAPDRVKYPLKRVGERGEGKFERISWDEALETTAFEIRRVRETYGPAALFLLSSGGDIGWLQGAQLTGNLLGRTGGFSTTWGWHSNGGTKYAAFATFGTIVSSNTRDNFIDSRLIIMWGWNPAMTVQHTNTSWHLMQAKEKGIKIISVDPRYTQTAAVYARQWIPIRPGTDAAMLIAMAHVMIDEDLYDKAFIDTYTFGFDSFKEYVLGKEDNIPKSPSWAEALTGVPAQVIRDLAVEYATTKPAILVAGIAPGRTAFGEQFHRVAITLSAMTGNIGVRGGDAPGIWGGGFGPEYELGLSFGPTVGQRLKGGSANPVDVAPTRKNALMVSEKFWQGWTSSNRVNRFHMADAFLNGKVGGYPADYKMMFVVNANPVTQYPNTNKLIQALKKLEFIVVEEQFLSPTARYADIVLPTNTFLERNDVTVGGATPFYGYLNKAIDSLYESKSHYEIAVELAKKMGVADFSDKTEDEWLRELVKGTDIPDYDSFRREAIQKVKLEKPRIAFEKQIQDPENNPFPTPSGKIEIYSRQLADMNDPMLPPIPKYIETWESRNDPLAEKYPLQLITSHLKRRAHSTFETIPWLREVEPQTVWMNTADAHARHIKDGDEVRIFNDRGEMIIPAKVTERIMPGVVDIPEGAWYQPDENGVDRGGCCNILERDKISPGEALASNTCLVQIEKADL